jgi:glycerol-3-phosphate dehydrogenase subunit B
MKQETRQYQTQLAIIGTGLAGFAASIFALNRGISTAQVGNTGAVAYTTGYFDLLGSDAGKLLDDPWKGLETLRQSEPNHPLSGIATDDIERAFRDFTGALSEMGIGYSAPGKKNLMAVLPSGVVKPTLSVPTTMMSGVEAYKTRARVVVVDFVGMQGFSARELQANFKPSWPHITAVTLAFPDMESGALTYAEVMARALEVPETRVRLAERIKAVLGDAEYVGLPAMLGVHAPDAVHMEMEKLVGLPIFEIPTMPPSVPGIRLREMFEQVLHARGLTLVPQHKVRRVDFEARDVTLALEDSFGEVEIEARAVILATGRFLSGGLSAEHDKVRETLMDINVRQPASREDWHRQHYFDVRGHPINRTGVEIDKGFRPLTAEGKPVDDRLFAAGSLLAHQDWVRQRCGAGVAICSAYKTVESAAKLLESTA